MNNKLLKVSIVFFCPNCNGTLRQVDKEQDLYYCKDCTKSWNIEEVKPE